MSPARRLRIAGGSHRGIRIEAPAGIRPTSERLREALGGIWAGRLPGARFLDLFAGSGAVGLEALSRGARSALLVEGERRVLAVLERNLRQVDLPGARVLAARLPAELGRRLGPEERFELVFADPPYGFDRFDELLAAVVPHLAAGGAVALEHGRHREPPPPPAALRVVSSRRYGDSVLTILAPPGPTG